MWRVALRVAWAGVAALVAGCSLRFAAPPLPSLPVLPPTPVAPTAQARALPVAAAAVDQIVAAPDVRSAAGSAVGLTPLRRAEGPADDIYARLVRRLLAAKVVRVVDLSGIEHIGAAVERNSSAQRLSYRGRLDRMLWVAELVQARFVVVSEALRVQMVARRVPRVLEFPEGAIAAYEAARSKWMARCRPAVDEAQRAQADTEVRWREAVDQYRKAQPWWALFAREPEYEEALADHEEWTRRAREVVATCGDEPPDAADVRKKHGTPADPGEMTFHEAQVRFRLLEVPGGRVVMAGRLVREADAPEAAQGMVVDALAAVLAGQVPQAGRRR